MPCDRFVLRDNQGNVIASGVSCRGRPRHRRCQAPGCHGPGLFQCDFPVTRKGKPGTCDLYLCASHRRPVAGKEDTDYCPAHAAHAARAVHEIAAVASGEGRLPPSASQGSHKRTGPPVPRREGPGCDGEQLALALGGIHD